METIIKVKRVLEYTGTKGWIVRTLAQSYVDQDRPAILQIKDEVVVCGIKEISVDEYPEIIREVPDEPT